ncbi:MAG: flagellar basal body P-ring formation protein FlgA [Acidobacteriaceae bacterium]|nr:flagellar basal body P-ring formation protein FlgA [Acidobacteriaceae bacterium]
MGKLVLFITALVSTLQAGCIAIDAPQIGAGDLAKADNRFAQLDPGLVFSFAPSIGSSRIIQASELDNWAGEHGLARGGYSAACFERPGSEFAPEEIRKAIESALGTGFRDLRIDVTEICRCRVPSGRLEFALSGASAPSDRRPDTPVLWKGRVLADGGDVYPVWVKTRVIATVTVVRAARNLRPQQPLTAEDMEAARVSASPLRFSHDQTVAAYVGKIATTYIEQGTVLQADMARSPSEVERGSLVRVEVVDGGARLELDARAETGGNRGDLITLTNPSGAARFHAYVTGPGHAQLTVSRQASAGELAVREPVAGNPGAGKGF